MLRTMQTRGVLTAIEIALWLTALFALATGLPVLALMTADRML